MSNIKTALEMATVVTMAQFAEPYVRGEVLDVGCGPKAFAKLFPGTEKWVGLDIRPGLGDITADAHDMPLPDNSFDTVVCMNVLHKCKFPPLVVRECARVLKPGGHLIIATPNTGPEDMKTLWNIKLSGLDYLVGQAGLKGVGLGVRGQGKLFSVEFNAFRKYFPHTAVVQEEFQGWLEEMDERYPLVSLAIAVKEG